jgi:hypothetical protein
MWSLRYSIKCNAQNGRAFCMPAEAQVRFVLQRATCCGRRSSPYEKNGCVQHEKSVLIVSWSQTGQLADVVNAVAAPFVNCVQTCECGV